MNYFTMHDADQFSFIRVPKELMTNPNYKSLSAESKLLYGVLLDRVGLSRKNNWIDNNGRVFIIYTRNDIAEIMGCGEKKITRLFSELKEKELVEEKRQGLQKPNLIYVGKFIIESSENCPQSEDNNKLNQMQDNCDSLQNRQNDGSGCVKKTVLDPSKWRASNTDINNTNISNTENSISQSTVDHNIGENHDRIDGQNDFEKILFYFNDHVFSEVYDNPLADVQMIDEIKLNVLDMYFSPAVSINGVRKCQDIIRSALMRLRSVHIDNIVYKYSNVADRIVNSKAYIQTMIYNEALEANLYISNQVAADQVEIGNWKD